MEANNFIGLSKKAAQNLAEEKNLIFRLIKVDNNNFFDYPEDNRDDRVCIEIEKNVVTKAVFK